jgi:hypothetical protein
MAKKTGGKKPTLDLKRAFIELHKGALRSAVGNLYMILIIAILSAIFGGFIVKWLGGYQEEPDRCITFLLFSDWLLLKVP